MAEKLKVGIIGVGGIANAHMAGWLDNPNAELVAGCDLNETVLNNWGAKYNIKNLTTKTSDLFNDSRVDIIDICTPNNYHAPLAIDALKAGKHVLCEKPLAPSPELIRDMIAARDASGKMLMTAQHFRFSGVAKAKS